MQSELAFLLPLTPLMTNDLSPLPALIIFELVHLTGIFQPQSDLCVMKMQMSACQKRPFRVQLLKGYSLKIKRQTDRQTLALDTFPVHCESLLSCWILFNGLSCYRILFSAEAVSDFNVAECSGEILR